MWFTSQENCVLSEGSCGRGWQSFTIHANCFVEIEYYWMNNGPRARERGGSGGSAMCSVEIIKLRNVCRERGRRRAGIRGQMWTTGVCALPHNATNSQLRAPFDYNLHSAVILSIDSRKKSTIICHLFQFIFCVYQNWWVLLTCIIARKEKWWLKEKELSLSSYARGQVWHKCSDRILSFVNYNNKLPFPKTPLKE